MTAFAPGDANNDGRDDLNLVHVSLKPVWLSSSLDAPILELRMEDVEADGKTS